MYVLEGSDCAIVPMKLPNKEAKASAEAAEGRAQTKENDAQLNTEPTQSGATRVPGVRRRAPYGAGKKAGTVHGFNAPSYNRLTSGKLLRPQAEERPREWTG
jgi:hypothetical protein